MSKLLIVVFWLCSFAASAQKDTSRATGDTLDLYEKSPFIPTFSIQQPDSSWFFNTKLKADKPVLILYFSPDCGHCKLETDELLGNIKQLENLQIVMVTSRPFEDLVKFSTHYKLQKFPTIVIGRDPAHYITRFYNVQFTPFSALYGKDGSLQKVYKKGIDMDELKKLVN